MIRDTIGVVLASLPVVGHHEILIGHSGSVITICVIYIPPDSNVERELLLINLHHNGVWFRELERSPNRLGINDINCPTCLF